MTRPVYPGVQVEEVGSARTISGVPTSIAAFAGTFRAGPLDQPVRCTEYASVEAQFGPSAELRQFFENGGREAWLVRLSQATRLEPLDEIDLFNTLCLPDAPGLPPDEMRAAYAEALECCERRHAFLIVDIPESVDKPRAMQEWLDLNQGLRHRNAAIYFPRMLVWDPVDPSRPREIGASGAIAGLFARLDAARGVWKAPAGTEARLYGTEGFAYALNDAEQRSLEALGVNCLRALPRFGYLCWGARTLDEEWKYIAPRRLALFIEESLCQGTQWAVFEPNGEPLWARIRDSVEGFMLALFREGAFAASTPHEAYFVSCGRDTMTQDDIDHGRLIIEVGMAPAKPAEFVIISIRQLMAGAADSPPADPYGSFKLRVVRDGRVVAGFSEVRGIHLAAAKYGSITLERGLSRDPELESWAGMQNPTRTDLTVELLDERGRVAARYVLHDAWVSAFQALPGFDPNDHAVAIERMTIEVEGMERD